MGDDSKPKFTFANSNNTTNPNQHTPHISETIKANKKYDPQPHRCDARLNDFLSGIGSTWSFKVGKELFRLYIRCLRSEYGEEPTEPYKYLSESQRKFYEDAEKKGNIRNKFFGGRKS